MNYQFFLDDGGIIEYDGTFNESIIELIDQIEGGHEAYAALITSQRPAVLPNLGGRRLPVVRLNPLQRDDIRQLISAVAHEKSAELQRQEINELSEQIKGYPPAVFYAIELTKHYGAQVLLSNTKPLVHFRSTYFLRILSNDQFLNQNRKTIMSLLSYYSPLKLPLIGDVLDISAEQLSKELAYLIDACFVVPERNGFYSLAEPLVDAVHRVMSPLHLDHSRIAWSLDKQIDELDIEEKRLELSRSLFRACMLSGRDDVKSIQVHLVSDLIEIMKQSYYDRLYERTIEYARQILELRPHLLIVRDFLCRALVQYENYEEAEAQIELIRNRGAIRDAYFL